MTHWEPPPLPKRTAGSVDGPPVYKRLAVSDTITSADLPSTDWSFCSGSDEDTSADFEVDPNHVLFFQLDDLLSAVDSSAEVSWSSMENAAAEGLLSLSRQPGQILVKLKSSGSALEVKNGPKMGEDDASASGTPPSTPAPTRVPTETPVPIPALFAASHTTVKPSQLRPLTDDELGTSKAQSSTVKGDGAMESSVDSMDGTPAPTPAPMPAPAPSNGEVFAPGDPSFMPSVVSISATQSDLNRMCAQAQIERTVAQLTQQDADREHALLQPVQILQAEHQSLQDQYGADQAAISESMAFSILSHLGMHLRTSVGSKRGEVMRARVGLRRRARRRARRRKPQFRSQLCLHLPTLLPSRPS